MRRVGVALALLYAGFAVAGPREVVADCARSLPPDAKGLATLENRCPSLRSALEELGVRELLSAPTRAELWSRSLQEAVSLLDPLGDGARARPDPASLPAALRAAGGRDEPIGWWQRFKAWLIERLTPRKRPAGVPAWSIKFAKWLAQLSPSEGLLLLVYFALLVLLLAAAGAVIIRELRAAGALAPRRRRAARDRAAAAGSDGSEPALTIADVERAPPAERPRWALRLVVQRLTASGRLVGERSVTHRELATRARLDDATARRQLAGLAALAERQLFAAGPLPAAAVEPVLTDARELLAALRRAPGRSS